MLSDFKKYKILDAVTPTTITSSTDATPIVVTATAHGLKTGQQVMIYGHTTNIAANGVWQVGAVTANTFALVNINTGLPVAGSGAGAGSSGICLLAPKIPMVVDFRNLELHVITSGTATTTIKVAGAFGGANGDAPNFGGTVSAANMYSFIQLVNLDTAATVNGATGIVVAGTDIANSYEINSNVLRYVCVFPVSWSAGVITVELIAKNNI